MSELNNARKFFENVAISLSELITTRNMECILPANNRFVPNNVPVWFLHGFLILKLDHEKFTYWHDKIFVNIAEKYNGKWLLWKNADTGFDITRITICDSANEAVVFVMKLLLERVIKDNISIST